MSGGFIDFPSATFVADPKSAYIVNKDATTFKSASTPYLYAYDSRGRLFYDRTRSRWLAVPREAVSPDGSSYVYALSDNTSIQPKVVHVVDVASGHDKTFPVAGIGLIPVPLDFAADGVYLTEGWEGTDGLWKLNPTTGAFQKLANTSTPEAYRNGKLWFVTPQPVPGKGADTVKVLDLASGKTTVWFHRSGRALGVEGFDAQGHPVMASYFQGVSEHLIAELWSVSTPGFETKLFAGEVYDKQFVLADQHGLWFGAAGGLYLYSQTSGLQRVSNKAVVPAGSCT